MSKLKRSASGFSLVSSQVYKSRSTRFHRPRFTNSLKYSPIDCTGGIVKSFCSFRRDACTRLAVYVSRLTSSRGLARAEGGTVTREDGRRRWGNSRGPIIRRIIYWPRTTVNTVSLFNVRYIHRRASLVGCIVAHASACMQRVHATAPQLSRNSFNGEISYEPVRSHVRTIPLPLGYVTLPFLAQSVSRVYTSTLFLFFAKLARVLRHLQRTRRLSRQGT